MSRMSKISIAAMVAVAGTLAFTASAQAEGPVLSGYVQANYWGNFSEPSTRVNGLQPFTPSSNSFGIPQAQLKLAKSVGEGDDNYGYGVKLLFGQNAGTIHSAGLGTDGSFDLEEAYGVYGLKSLKGLTLTAGKFVTNMGVEVIESPLNMNISNGLLFFNGMPYTNTGAKANYVISDMINVTAGLVNGWDVATDNNSGKTITWQVATTPAKGLVANLQGTYGPELLANAAGGNISKRTSLDAVLGYTGIDKLSLFVEGLWGQDTNIGGTDDSGVATWAGAGAWVGYAVSDLINPALRFETFDDRSGSRIGSRTTANNFTLTNKFILNKNLFVRVEYRHDFANNGIFTGPDAQSKRCQNTGGADLVVMF